MSLSQCPQCFDEVSVPETAGLIVRKHPDAMMRCPRCGEQSPLRQLTLAPMIEIIDRDGHPLHVAGGEIGGHPMGDDRDDDFVSSSDTSPAIDFGDSVAFEPSASNEFQLDVGDQDDDDAYQLGPAVGSTGSVSPAAELRTGPPRSRKATPVWKSLLSVAVGPPLAIVLGYFILSAAGRVPNLGFWPFINDSATVSNGRSAASPARSAAQSPIASSIPSTPPAFDPPSSDTDDEEADNSDAVKPIELAMPGTDESMQAETSIEPDERREVAETTRSTTGEDGDNLGEDVVSPNGFELQQTPPALQAKVEDVKKRIERLASLSGRALQEPTVRAYELLSEIGSAEPVATPAVVALLDTVNQSVYRDKFEALSKPILPRILRNGDGLFAVGTSTPDKTFIINGHPPFQLETDDESERIVGRVMVLGKVDSTSEPKVLRASVMTEFGP